MKIIAWNCRGLGNRPAVRGLVDIQRQEVPGIMFLSETRMDEGRMGRFRAMLDMPNMLVQNNRGKSGGLALFSRKGLKVTLRWVGRMHIDTIVEEEEEGFKWWLTGIYGESHAEKKGETWRLLRTLHHQIQLPWVCMGDFNEVLFNHEK